MTSANATTNDTIETAELLGGLSESIFASSAPAMAALGWSVFPQEAHGERRMPGKLYGRTIRWSEDHDLSHTPPTPTFLRDCVLQCASLNVACVFGAASGHTFAVDIDVTDARIADEIRYLAEDILGATPFVRVGRAPKIALIYRHEAGDVVRSVSKRLADADGRASEHGLEILGAGKLITMHGRHHKTGHYFKWIGSASPLLDGPELAPLVTAAEVEAFIEAVEARFPFSSAASFSTVWPVTSSGAVRIARATREPGEALIADGREEYLSQLVWQTVRANGAAVVAAEGRDALHALVVEISQAVAEEFAANAKCDGRWAPASLRTEVGQRVSRLASKIASGEVRPSASRHTDQVVATPDAVAKAETLPVIFLAAGDIEGVVSAAERALIAAGRGVYQRGGRIVAVGETPVMTAAGKEISSQRIYEVGDYALLEYLGSAADWEKHDARRGQSVRAAPPMWVAKSLAERSGRLALPVLAGVISGPTLRADGSILEASGYDAATGLLLDTRGTPFPPVPEAPTREDAQKALASLSALIATFPFVTPADRAVALAALLTAPVRRSLRSAPLFAFTAPVAGSGKSTLVDLAAILATGREAGVIAQGKTEEESEKRLGSLLLGGDAVIAIDNCEAPVGGDLLCQVLTQTTVRPRVLGRSEAPEVPTSAFVAATGNNLILAGDMTRRGLLCRLDPQVERPELRVFDKDPLVTLKSERGTYLVAVLTVLRAYHVAGRPAQATPLGSFGEWSRTVRDALLWLGEDDPVATMEAARELDPKLDAMMSVTTQWARVIGQGFHTARDIIEKACETRLSENGNSASVNPDFREALMTVAGDGRMVTTRRLGKWLQAHSGRIAAGMQIAKGPLKDGTATWQLTGKGSGPEW